jgi:hypothetical protein
LSSPMALSTLIRSFPAAPTHPLPQEGSRDLRVS